MSRSSHKYTENINYDRVSEIINKYIEDKGYVTAEDLQEAFFSNAFGRIKDWAKGHFDKAGAQHDAEKIMNIQQDLNDLKLFDKLNEKEQKNLNTIMSQMVRYYRKMAV
jgi:hypothetical protein